MPCCKGQSSNGSDGGSGGRDGAQGRVLRFWLRPLRAPDGGRVRLTMQWPATGHSDAPAAAAASSPSASGPPGAQRLAVHLFLAKPASALIAAFGRHSTSRAWLPRGTADLWHRDAAFHGWDERTTAPSASGESGEDARVGERLLYDHRIFVGGLSDEAGLATTLAMAIKQLGAPVLEEVAKLEEFVDETLYQGSHADRRRFLQSSSDHAVRLSMLYWSDELNKPAGALGRAATEAAPQWAVACRRCWPDQCPWNECWGEWHSLESWRAYNYPHVTAVYWSLYRLGRRHSPSLVRRHDWRWYLRRATDTAMAMWALGGEIFGHELPRVEGQPWTQVGGGVGTTTWGVMVGSVYESLLRDLLLEGWQDEARALQSTVERRMSKWLSMPFPCASPRRHPPLAPSRPLPCSQRPLPRCLATAELR